MNPLNFEYFLENMQIPMVSFYFLEPNFKPTPPLRCMSENSPNNSKNQFDRIVDGTFKPTIFLGDLNGNLDYIKA